MTQKCNNHILILENVNLTLYHISMNAVLNFISKYLFILNIILVTGHQCK